MFAHIVECYVSKRPEFNASLESVVRPTLQSQNGFVDWMALTSDYEPDRTLSVALWNSKADAERYHRDHYEEMVELLRPFLHKEPSVDFYRVEASTVHHIQAGRAA